MKAPESWRLTKLVSAGLGPGPTGECVFYVEPSPLLAPLVLGPRWGWRDPSFFWDLLMWILMVSIAKMRGRKERRWRVVIWRVPAKVFGSLKEQPVDVFIVDADQVEAEVRRVLDVWTEFHYRDSTGYSKGECRRRLGHLAADATVAK